MHYLLTLLCLPCSHCRPKENKGKKKKEAEAGLSPFRLQLSAEGSLSLRRNLLYTQGSLMSSASNIFSYVKLSPLQKSFTHTFECILFYLFSNCFKAHQEELLQPWVSVQLRGSSQLSLSKRCHFSLGMTEHICSQTRPGLRRLSLFTAVKKWL